MQRAFVWRDSRHTMRFSHPHFLLLLPVVLLFLWWAARGSYAALGRERERWTAAIRVVLIALLVFALAGAQLVRPTSALCTVFVADLSDSTSADHERAAAYVRDATRSMRSGDSFAVVAFGGESLLERASDESTPFKRFLSVPVRSRTDIAAGIRLAMASFPPDVARQVVIISDGHQNLGDVLQQADAAATSDVRISVAPLGRNSVGNEALLLRAESPPRARIGAPFPVNVIAESRVAADGTITLYQDGRPVTSRAVHLRPGRNVVSFESTSTSGGLRRLRAVLDVLRGGDTRPENNIVESYTEVSGRPRILVVEGVPGDAEPVADALRVHNVDVVRGGPDYLPTSLAACAQYDSLVLANLPSWAMTSAQMSIIQAAVRDTGMGFAMIGGDESFGAGGYLKTPIEETLPLDMTPRKQLSLPTLTLVIVIDISGSMSADEDGVAKIRLASRAAQAAVELLQPVDQVAVIGFDTAAVPTVPLTLASDKEGIYRRIDRLQPGGGGIVALPALKEAHRVIAGAKSQVKHVIICADAADTEANDDRERDETVALARRMAGEHITISMIGFGTRHDPDVAFHERIARAGGGTAYLAQRLSSLPQIFTRDVMYAARSLLVEEPFRVQLTDATHPAIRNLPLATSPRLLGYVGTSLKPTPTARELLASPRADPLLAVWPYGLGRSLAFTSDASAHWALDWLSWPAFPAFWSQSLRWTLRQETRGNFSTAVTEDGGRALVSVDAVGVEGEFRNLLDLEAHVTHLTTRGGRVETSSEVVPLAQLGPGRYEAGFDARDAGAYLVTVVEKRGAEAVGMQTVTLSVPYSPEFRTVGADLPLLTALADRGRGAFDPVPADVFTSLRFSSPIMRDLWPVLLALAAFLFLLDVAARRVVIPWSEALSSVRAWAAARFPVRPALAPAAHAPTLDALLSARDRVRPPTFGSGASEGSEIGASPAAGQPPDGEAGPPPVMPPLVIPPVLPPRAGGAAPPPADPTASTSRLLRRKREREEQ